MKEIKAADATKHEILLWFGMTVNGKMAQGLFEKWLREHRIDELRKAYENAVDESLKEFEAYTKILQQAKGASIDEKLKIMKKAEPHFQKHEAWEEEVKRLEKKMDEWF